MIFADKPIETLAVRFCAKPSDASTAFIQVYGGEWQALTMDDSAEIHWPDGSIASCLNGGPWLPVSLSASAEAAAEAEALVSKAERDGYSDDDLYFADERGEGLFTPAEDAHPAPLGWDVIEA